MKHQLIMPSSIDHLRNVIIDKLKAISSKDYLTLLNKLVEHSVVENYLTHPDQFEGQMMKDFIKTPEKSLDKEKEEEFPEYVVNGIKKAQEDMKSGRSISLEAFKERLSINK